MRITIRALCGKEIDDAFMGDDSPGAVFRLPDFDATSPEFDRLLEVSKTGRGCWFNPWMEFTAQELAQSRFFQLDCRGKIIREKGGDYDLNVARLRSLPFIKAGPGARIRLLDRIALRGASVGPNSVACATDWMAEFVVSRDVGRIFESEGLTGFTLRPIFDSKTKADNDTVFQLYTDHIMPRALVDATTPTPRGQPKEDRRQLACLTYDFGGNPPTADFHRTAEAWSNNDMPVWIVSARVRECFARHKLRGWAFRPVLEVGTALHLTYKQLWEDLFARVAASNPRHHF
jgi:hypothetical protein